jgi:hypothetical protein
MSTESLPSEEKLQSDSNVIARWDLFEIELVDIGGDSQIVQFKFGDEFLTIAGCNMEFMKKVAKVLYEDVHVEIVVRKSQ